MTGLDSFGLENNRGTRRTRVTYLCTVFINFVAFNTLCVRG
jgi:hypothetical protein